MVEVCSVSNLHVLMDTTHPQKKGEVSQPPIVALLCTDVSLLSVPPPTGVFRLCRTSQSRRL